MLSIRCLNESFLWAEAWCNLGKTIISKYFDCSRLSNVPVFWKKKPNKQETRRFIYFLLWTPWIGHRCFQSSNGLSTYLLNNDLHWPLAHGATAAEAYIILISMNSRLQLIPTNTLHVWWSVPVPWTYALLETPCGVKSHTLQCTQDCDDVFSFEIINISFKCIQYYIEICNRKLLNV